MRSSNPCITSAVEELERVGIRDVEIAFGGKHPQIRFRVADGPLHIFSIPGTPSDFRSPANTRTSLRRYLAENGVDLNLTSEPKNVEKTPSRIELLERRVAELERRFGTDLGIGSGSNTHS